MRLLLTGAAGYTGRGMAQVLGEHHEVRGFDVQAATELEESMVADLTDLDACRAAVDGIDAVVMCHMAPNPKGYETPVMAIDVNVKGTANLYHAMVEKGVKRAVLISTQGVLHRLPGAKAYPGDGPYNFNCRLYSLTKQMQESLTRYYYETAQVITTVLRPSWIVYDGTLTTKYGQKMEAYNSSLIDPRDIGRAAHLSLALKDATLEAFNLAQDDDATDLQPARARLGWRAEHRFEALPRVE